MLKADEDNPATAHANSPKSFVVKSGPVGPALKALVADVRQVLEPNTASRLKERKSNRLRDYITMAGPLGVTHLLVISQSQQQSTVEQESSNVNLRLARLPRGPTLGFKILRYALARDVLAATKRPRSPGREFAAEALVSLGVLLAHKDKLSRTLLSQLILNNFGGEDQHLKLMTTMFQNLFPPIKVQTVSLFPCVVCQHVLTGSCRCT